MEQNLSSIIYRLLPLIAAVPLGLALAQATKEEKQIYSKKPYFPILLWALAFAAAITFTLNKQIFLTLAFLFVTTLVWNKA